MPLPATIRASRRPKKISTSGRATWVERTRSVGRWNVAALRALEWRRAAEAALGANGSWTWTTSKSIELSRPSSEREMSTGTGAGLGRPPAGSLKAAPTDITAGPSSPARSPSHPAPNTAAPSPRIRAMARCVRRRSARVPPGAAITTRCPRAFNSAAAPAAYALTS